MLADIRDCVEGLCYTVTHMKIGVFGAGNQVTGSCYLVETKDAKVLVDCGYYQGLQACSMRNYDEFGFDPSSVDAICITHAHLDHHGRLPRLFRQGADCSVYSTAPTRDLAELVLEDAYNIMLEETERCSQEPLHSEADVERVLAAWETFGYRDARQVAPGVTITFFNSGHILGSAFILLEADGKRVVFSGDVGNDNVPILPATDALPQRLDMLLCEATYGDRLHSPTKDRLGKLRTIVEETTGDGGVLMIPAFSIERTQELLFDLNQLVDREHVRTGPVFLDSPLGIGATYLYERYREELQLTFPEGWQDDDFFQFKGLEITERVDQSKRINSVKAPKVIIAGSGMMNAGRIHHHLLRNLNDPKSTVLIIGYQAEGALGRSIQDGAKAVEIQGYDVDVRARVETIDSYSAHADYDKLTRWIKDSGVQRVRLTHGDDDAKATFKKHLKFQGVGDVEVPKEGDWITV